ncbi:GNAT family N-acetyltransferase [Treponema sp. R80B11-R83G3]
MSDSFYWRKIKKRDFKLVEKLLKDNENNYVNACAKFIARNEVNTLIWVLCTKEKIQALLINSKSNILPVLCGVKIPPLDLKKGFLPAKKIHSAQGLKNDVIILEGELGKNGWKAKEIIDYELMSLDSPPSNGKNLSNFSNLVLRTPVMTDIDAMAPLQAGYEKEEVLPKGSSFSPIASRLNLSNIIAKGQVLAAEIDGRLIGKINVSGVSFTRYQIGGVYVHPYFRGKGIGRLMAYEFISSLIAEGRGVTLFVRKTNTAARRLYLSLGFTAINDYRISYY